MQVAKQLYEAAGKLYQMVGSDGLFKRSAARALFASLWLEQNSEKRRAILETCISLSNEAAQLFESRGVSKDLAETHKEILTYLREGVYLATEWKNRLEMFERTIEIGRKTINEMMEIGDDDGLVEALHLTLWMLAVEAEVILDPLQFKQMAGETIRFEKMIVEASKRIGTAHALSLANEASGDIAWDLDGDLAKALALYQAATASARDVKDSLQTGRLLSVLASLQHKRAIEEEHLEQRRKVAMEGLMFAEEAIQTLTIPYHTSYLARAYSACASCYWDLADLVETDPERKMAQLAMGVEMAGEGMTFEYRTEEWSWAAHEWSKAMYFLAKATTDSKEKAKLLGEILPVRLETVSVIDALQPNSWNRGVWRNYLALIKAELANVEQDLGSKVRLLREAAADMEECLNLCERWVQIIPGSGRRLYRYSEWYGDILHQLYLASQDIESAERSIRAYFKAVEYLTEAEQVGPVPTIRWKVARLYDSLGNFEQASETFEKAADDYETVTKKIPGSSPAFHELAVYMKAWALMEKARLQHVQEDYDLSHENYVGAARLLREAKSWSGLGMLCDARSLLEKGEALSQEEKHEAAVEFLKQALDRFRNSGQELGKIIKTAADNLEKREFQDWIRIGEEREAYTRGRIELEEARSLDRSGEKAASSRKYLSASVAFKTLAGQIVIAQDRAETETLAQFCESWALMKEAESKSSPELFAAAAESFMSARSKATNPRLRLLALANASICRALESGTRFRQSRDPQHYSEIKRHLEVASDHYTEAGFKKTGTWTRATQRLFDALMLLAGAEVEREIKKKTELYHQAEKHLVLAAKLYGEAGFPSRKRETLEHLERTREEKEVLLAPLEALAGVPTSSATNLPSMPLRGAQPLGLERFEDARVTGELRTTQTEMTVGSEFTVSIDIVNVGKTSATMIKMEGIVPEGCEPLEKQALPGLEGNSLDLRGKRLEYLQTHEVKLSLRANRKGAFNVSPRAIYVDEKGNYKSTNLQPLFLTIREPGISAGLQAPPTVHVPDEFRFENERSREVFSRLVKEFLDDYMTRRIVMEKAGWRSLMDVIRDLKIPRSALYGPSGRTGPVLAELERRGLVETRVFPKERGRGGEIKKVRVAYENTIVKRVIDRAVMENT